MDAVRCCMRQRDNVEECMCTKIEQLYFYCYLCSICILKLSRHYFNHMKTFFFQAEKALKVYFVPAFWNPSYSLFTHLCERVNSPTCGCHNGTTKTITFVCQRGRRTALSRACWENVCCSQGHDVNPTISTADRWNLVPVHSLRAAAVTHDEKTIKV